MKTTHFYYFSGTGNSCFLAETANRALGGSGVTPLLNGVTGDAEFLFFVSPVHAFIPPWEVIKALVLSPNGAGKKAAVIMARGAMKIGEFYVPGLEGVGLYLQALILWLKGYEICGVKAIDMPSNWLLVHSPIAETDANDMTQSAVYDVTQFAQKLIAGEKVFGGYIQFLIGLVLLPISFAYLTYGRFILGQLNFYTNKCTGCELCADKCPTGSIVMQFTQSGKRPCWKLSCAGCMRCLNICPHKAIEESHLWLVILMVLTGYQIVPPMLIHLYGGTLPGAFYHQPLAFALKWTNFIFILALAVHIFRTAIRNAKINDFFLWGSLTRLYGRYNTAAAAKLPGAHDTVK